MNRLKIYTISFLLLIVFSIHFMSSEVVNTTLGKEFITIFPELTRGYIDLNMNGQMDRLDDMDEKVPDSGIKDGIIQVQEILDFIETNYRFIPMEKLQIIKSVLSKASGDIPQLIALNYSWKIDEIIKIKEQTGAHSLYLTPSALKKAQEKMLGYIATMLNAYRKEQKKYETDFTSASDQLFRMIEAGYPLPDLNKDDHDLLVNLTLYTIGKNKKSNKKRVLAAVRTLGRLKARQAIPSLSGLLDSPDYGYESALALGNIGNSDSREVLISKIKAGASGKLETGIIQALGVIGGTESENILISLLQTTKDQKIDPEIKKTAIGALSEITKRDIRNRKTYSILSSYLLNPDKNLRILAIRGIAHYKSAAAVALLLPILKNEKSEDVKIELVKSLSSTNNPNAVPAITALLKDSGSSLDVKQTVISALGDNSNGSKSVFQIVDYLGDKSSILRTVTRQTLEKLYKQNSPVVIGILNRKLATRKDELFLKEASSLLAKLADPTTTQTITNLLQSAYPSVKKNATWALYRIRPENNLKVVTELQKLVTSETESTEVRINAVRALGAMGFDPPRADVWKTLIAPLKLQDVKYSMLKLFSVQAIGQLGTVNRQVISALTAALTREKNETMRISAVEALGSMNGLDTSVEKILVRTFKRSKDPNLRLPILEVLGDMGSSQTPILAPLLFTKGQSPEVKYRVIYALSRVGDEKSLSVLLDETLDSDVSGYLTGILEDADRTILSGLLARKIRTETNPTRITAFEALKSSFEDTF